MKREIGDKIRILRTSMKMNQKDFAKMIDTTQTSLSFYETGSKTPPTDILIKIAECSGASLDWLCGNKVSRHFATGTDIIDLLLELKELHDFDFKIDSEVTHDISEKYNYKSTLTFEESRKRKDSFDTEFNISDLTDFLKEYSDLVKKLDTLDDADIKKNYFDMWIEKKREKYSHYKVEYEDEYQDRFTKEFLEQFPLLR